MNFCAIPTMTISVIIYREMGTNPLKETKKKKKRNLAELCGTLNQSKMQKQFKTTTFSEGQIFWRTGSTKEEQAKADLMQGKSLSYTSYSILIPLRWLILLISLLKI